MTQRNVEESLEDLLAEFTTVESGECVLWPDRNDLTRTDFRCDLAVSGRVVYFDYGTRGIPEQWRSRKVWSDDKHILFQFEDRRYFLLWNFDDAMRTYGRSLSLDESLRIELPLDLPNDVEMLDEDEDTESIRNVIQQLTDGDVKTWDPLEASDLGMELYFAQRGKLQIPSWIVEDYLDFHPELNVWRYGDTSLIARQPAGLPLRLFWIWTEDECGYCKQLTATESELLNRTIANHQ